MAELNMTQINKTLERLKRHNMETYFVETKEEVVPLLKTLMKEGEILTHGGSDTLKQCGVVDLLNSGEYNYLDRSKAESPEEVEKIYRAAYTADTYLTSANAITEGGQLFNVDGNSNRVSAICYGPKQVVVICGFNKIVKDLDDAVVRLKTTASPMNTKRLGCDTYCAREGECLALGRDASYMCDGCMSPQRICCNYVITAFQRDKERIKVIIVGEKLGF